MWFNNVEVTDVHAKNGVMVYSFVTKNGHKVRGITKFDMMPVVKGQTVNVAILNKDKATYVTAIVAPKMKAA